MYVARLPGRSRSWETCKGSQRARHAVRGQHALERRGLIRFEGEGRRRAGGAAGMIVTTGGVVSQEPRPSSSG